MSTTWGTQDAVAPAAHADAVAALGRRIHGLRVDRGLTLQEFAALAGLTAPVLSALERGDESVPTVVLFAAAQGLGVPVAALFADAAPAIAAPVAEPPAIAAAAVEPPAGYRPLEMPDLWEPPGGTSFDQPAFRQPEQASRQPEPAFRQPEPTYPAVAAPVPIPPPAPVQQALVPAAAPPHPATPAPRTFADLRVGVLADRSFASLPEFAVAAVVEAGYAVAVVASIFRVPVWRLETWLRDAATAKPAAKPLRRAR